MFQKIFRAKKWNVISCISLCLMLAVTVLTASIGASVPAVTSCAETVKNEMRVVGYLPDWYGSGVCQDIDYASLTHLNLSFCNIKDANSEMSYGLSDKTIKSVVDEAHKNNVKVLAAIGGGGGGDQYHALTADSAKIKALDDKIVAFCEKHNLDGVDLDIEFDSSDSIWKNYGMWVSDLRSRFDERGWLLSTATAGWVSGSTSAATFAMFDYVNVMAYDNSGDKHSHASYDFAVSMLNYFHTTKQVPKEKLVLGVPFYGYSYDSNGNMNWNSYKPFKEIVAVSAANFKVDTYEGYAYNGAETMRKKCNLAKDYGGIMIWEITQDAKGEYSLLALIYNELFPSKSNGGDGTNPDDGTDSTGSSVGTGGSESTDGQLDNSKVILVSCIVGGCVLAVAAVAVIVVFVRKKK